MKVMVPSNLLKGFCKKSGIRNTAAETFFYTNAAICSQRLNITVEMKGNKRDLV